MEKNATTEPYPGMTIPVPERRQVIVTIPFPSSFVYSNCAAFSMSAMDFRIGFGEAMQDGHAEARVGVIMPPEQAANLALLLLHQLTLFEERFGDIRNPAWKAAKQGISESLPSELPADVLGVPKTEADAQKST